MGMSDPAPRNFGAGGTRRQNKAQLLALLVFGQTAVAS